MLFDMMIGGVSEGDEDPRTTAGRELGEELGLVAGENLSAERLFSCGVATGYNRCIVALYEYEGGGGEEVRHQEEEVCWGGWVDGEIVVRGAENEEDEGVVKAFNGMLGEVGAVERVEWVPDGLRVWEKFRAYEKNHGRRK